MIIYIIFALLKTPKGECEYPIAEVDEHAEPTPKILERWSIWIAIAVALILVAYAIPVAGMIMNDAPGSPGYTTW